MSSTRIGLVGAGIVGLAIARRLADTVPDVQLTVMDKETRVGAHQTGHNSGVVHAGVYYAPGSLKARLCRQGMGLLREYCAQTGIEYRECGKLIVAVDDQELARLDELEGRGTANAVPGLRRLGPEQMLEIEPHVSGVAALHSPRTAIVDFVAVAEAYAGDVTASGGELRLGFEVSAIRRAGAEITVRSSVGEELVFDRLIVCGGLQSDRLALMAGEDREPAIIAIRGEYCRLAPSRADLVKGLIYPVPDPAYPFLGVHFTRRVNGSVDIGPNAVLALAREGYRRGEFSLPDIVQTLRAPGFRALARRHLRMGARELRGTLSRRAFVAQARRFIPELTIDDVLTARAAGVRAQAVDRDGSLVDDFRITHNGGIVLIRNAPSPAATSSMAIAQYVVNEIYGRP